MTSRKAVKIDFRGPAAYRTSLIYNSSALDTLKHRVRLSLLLSPTMHYPSFGVKNIIMLSKHSRCVSITVVHSSKLVSKSELG